MMRWTPGVAHKASDAIFSLAYRTSIKPAPKGSSIRQKKDPADGLAGSLSSDFGVRLTFSFG